MENEQSVTSLTRNAPPGGLHRREGSSITRKILPQPFRHWTRVFIACLLPMLYGTLPAGAVVVSTTHGNVEGTSEDGLEVFRGIPYAAAPVDGLRWRPPQPPAPYVGTLDASQFGAVCPQFGFFGIVGDEDCLFLNVWTPQESAGLPVMVWIHGGGHVQGSGDGGPSLLGPLNPTYDGQYLARRGNVVFVSLNYRLGPLGFLAHPALTTEEALHPSSGNYGQEDQIAALQWIRDNIANFGGDPNNVTIFGESAGSFSVSSHLVTPQSDGLFQRAIMQSGVADFQFTLPQVEPQGEAFETAISCSGVVPVLPCLRGKTVEQVLTALPLPAGFFFGDGAFWGPIVDGYVIPEQPFSAFASGNFSRVPLIIGNNTHEGTLFPALVGAGLTPPIYNAFLDKFFGPGADAVRAEYPCTGADCSAFETAPFLVTPADNAIAEVATNHFFVCPARRVARVISGHDVPIYVYTSDREVMSPFFPFEVGATHFAEVSFVFGTAALSFLSPEEEPLSHKMMDHWTHFAQTGDPNNTGPGLPWHEYRYGPSSDEKRIVFNLKTKQATKFKENNCDFFDQLVLGP